MRNEHWSESQVIEALYGLPPANDHLSGCEACRERYDAVRERRNAFLAVQPEVSSERLARQRHAIRARLAPARPGLWARLAPAAAAVMIVGAFVIDFGSRPQPGGTPAADDRQVFQEVFDLVSDPAPRAVEPIRVLFEEQP